MVAIGRFPFGQTIFPVTQEDLSPKKVFILGVYASAVHARWQAPGKSKGIRAVAVASEPEIFWRGDDGDDIIAGIRLPHGAGQLIPAGDGLNGPSGRALDKKYLEPLGLTRADVWLCDLVPHSCMNARQGAALCKHYDPIAESLGLSDHDWPAVPKMLADEVRRNEIESELARSKARVVITLGDQPLKWFTSFYGSKSRLRSYGADLAHYGALHPVTINGQKLQLLPLVHPRQAGRLGGHSVDWANLHEHWKQQREWRLL